ncbi:MAG: ATP-binding protein [Candidatus Delongbacteria bacterium]|nr:ATP-binding protein [Candidatus Delongbacteria bacterium]
MNRKQNVLTVSISVLFVIIFSYVFYSHYIEMRTKTINQELSEYKMVAYQTAIGIETQLDMIAKDLHMKSERKSIKYFDEIGDLDWLSQMYIDVNGGFVRAITRTDSNANIIYTYPYNDDALGVNIAHQKHIKKILKTHEPVISDVFTAVQGYESVVMHYPIFVDDKYNGSIAYLISFDELLGKYVDKYDIEDRDVIRWILSPKGIILNSNRSDENSTDVNDLVHNNILYSKGIKELLSEEEIDFSYNYDSSERVGFHIKVKLPFNNYWKIFYSIDESSIVSEMHDFIKKALLVLFLLIAGLFYTISKIFSYNKLIHDHEKRKAIEKSLRESRRLYRAIVKDITSIICRFDADGKILFFNRTAVNLFKEEKKQLKNSIIYDLFFKEDSKKIKKIVDELYIEDRITNFEQSVKINNVEYWFYWTVRAIFNSKSEIDEYQIIGTDINEYKKSEERERLFLEKMQHSEKMEALGNLAAGIAHDFNNILMGIQGNISILKLKLSEDEKSHEKLEKIEDYIDNASNLARQMLGIAKGGKYDLVSLNMNEVIHSILKFFIRTNKEISTTEDLDKDLKNIEADKTQMNQVILNIMVNASQAIVSKGEIHVETKNVILNSDFLEPYNLPSGEYVKISIKDNGIGMDKKTQKKIFDPFFTTKHREKGTGLGLSSVFGIVKNHGGIIAFHSVKDEGTIFDLFFPVTNKDISQNEFNPNKLEYGDHQKVLIIDDEKMVLETTSEVLKSLHYSPILAMSGMDGLEIFTKEYAEISLVILDMIMPKMDGEEIFRELKKIDPNVKVLISSGYSITGKTNKILDNGGKGFIQKPFNITDLSVKIKSILEVNKKCGESPH